MSLKDTLQGELFQVAGNLPQSQTGSHALPGVTNLTGERHVRAGAEVQDVAWCSWGKCSGKEARRRTPESEAKSHPEMFLQIPVAQCEVVYGFFAKGISIAFFHL
uniref:Uncharacterized protein n=1 Tax=Sphaerodactylus townsendi TaxID=933632 RepID=A0ACB8FVJ2_9SAUR